MKKNQKAKTDPPPQYDHIGKMYDEYSNTATFKQAERYSYLQIVGSLQGLRVLDLACGFRILYTISHAVRSHKRFGSGHLP